MIHVMDIDKKIMNGKSEITLLKNITFQVGTAEIVAVMGKSGCGKSTLLSILAGLDRPSRGSVLIDDVDLYKLNKEKLDQLRNQKIGIVFQNYNLISELDCYGNVMVPLLFSQVKKKDPAYTRELLSMVKLSGKLHLYPSQMSGGEQQRAAVVRALCNKPGYLFADEPTGALDEKNGAEIMGLLKRCRDKFNTTIVIVTHDPDIGKQCDRILYMNEGMIENG